MGIEQTKGHTADGSGLRGHSVGELFPYILMGKGCPGNFGWYILCPNGDECGPYPTAKQAFACGMDIKAYDETWEAVPNLDDAYRVGDEHPSNKDKGDLLCYGV